MVRGEAGTVEPGAEGAEATAGSWAEDWRLVWEAINTECIALATLAYALGLIVYIA